MSKNKSSNNYVDTLAANLYSKQMSSIMNDEINEPNNLHQAVLNSIKSHEKANSINASNSIVSPSSPSALSSSSISSSASSSSINSSSTASCNSALVAAVTAILQSNQSNASLAAVLQAMNNSNNNNNNNVLSAKDMAKLNLEAKVNQSKPSGGLDANLLSMLAGGDMNKPKAQMMPAPKRTYNKTKKAEEDKNSLLSSATAALMAAAAMNGGQFNLNLLNNGKNSRGPNGSKRPISISPNSHGTSSTCSDDHASETLSSGSPPLNGHGYENLGKKQDASEYSELDECNDLNINESNQDDENENNDDLNDMDETNNSNNFCSSIQKELKKQRNDSISSPARSSASQPISRSMSPSNSDYHHDSLTNSTAAVNSPFSTLDSTALLAAQSLLQQGSPFSGSTPAAGMTPASPDVNNLSFLSDAATAALISSQPNSVAALIASRKRRSERETNERVKKIKSVPDDKKDDAYWERRRKNNDAAKRSRDLRRQKEDEIANRASFLESENLKLKAQITVLRTELSKLHFMLYNRS